ncbi:MAG TPA: hypothetical protein VMV92_20715 [Streptosporangiaceae bacterium]|nr:hypothetical protein [Streptosporangiaceae bacterium]
MGLLSKIKDSFQEPPEVRAAREAEAQRLRDLNNNKSARQAEMRAARDAQDRREDIIRWGQECQPNELPRLGVVIQDDGKVSEWDSSRVLGPLHGAQAGIAGSVKTRGAGTAVAATAAFGIVGAAAALGARGGKPFAYVVFPDGTLHQSELTDQRVAARAQADVIRFNMLAAQDAGSGADRQGQPHGGVSAPRH